MIAIRRLADRHPDIEVILPAHPHPAVRTQAESAPAGADRITVTGPLPCSGLSRLLSEAWVLPTTGAGR